MPFMILEGGEGSGKDTQIDLLKKRLDPERTVFTREPGGTALGERLRSLLLDMEISIEPEVELLLFVAARTELMKKVIRPAVEAGKLVISNRFGLSTIAYQIYGREQMCLMPFLEEISRYVLHDFEPPYCFLLDVPSEIGIARVIDRNDGMTRFDSERLEFHRRVRSGYIAHYNDSGRGVCIDACLPVTEVAKRIEVQMRDWGLI